MDYIQRTFAQAIRDKKDILFRRYNSLKNEIIAHCEIPLMKGFIVASEEDEFLRLKFPDLSYGVYAKPRIAFDNELQAGLRVNFFDANDNFVLGLLLHPNGYFVINPKSGGPYAPYEHDDERLPSVLIHALLTSAHESGRIAL